MLLKEFNKKGAALTAPGIQQRPEYRPRYFYIIKAILYVKREVRRFEGND